MKRADFSFSYDCQGYMIQYKGENIGGAGTLNKPKHWRHQRANLIQFKEHAEIDIDNILRGNVGHYAKALKGEF